MARVRSTARVSREGEEMKVLVMPKLNRLLLKKKMLMKVKITVF
jgi:hypothetical protein